MPNNIARQVLGVRVGETDTKEYIPPVSKGDLISYDDALVIPQGVVKAYSGSIPAAAFNTLNSAPFELVPASASNFYMTPIAIAYKVPVITPPGASSTMRVANSYLISGGENCMNIDPKFVGIYFNTTTLLTIYSSTFDLSGTKLPIILYQSSDDAAVAFPSGMTYTIYYVEYDL